MRPGLVGLLLALVTLVVDQGHKHWMLYVYDIPAREPVRVGPFLDLVMAWNPGISYSLLSAETPAGRWGLLAMALIATGALSIWMWRTQQRLTAWGLGFIVGGALGNAWDRFWHGAVADFFLLHIDTQSWGRLNWYVFNLADAAIVAGVAILLYESFLTKDAGRQAEKAG